jgi:hypothetical protein
MNASVLAMPLAAASILLAACAGPGDRGAVEIIETPEGTVVRPDPEYRATIEEFRRERERRELEREIHQAVPPDVLERARGRGP